MSLRSAATSPSSGMNLARLETFLAFLAKRLGAHDYAEAESLLHAAIDPTHAARRHREASAMSSTAPTAPGPKTAA